MDLKDSERVTKLHQYPEFRLDKLIFIIWEEKSGSMKLELKQEWKNFELKFLAWNWSINMN